MTYPIFTINVSVILFCMVIAAIVGVVVIVLCSLKRRVAASAVGGLAVVLLASFMGASGFLDAARTNEMLRIADDLKVPTNFTLEGGNRSERIIQASETLPCLAVTAPCPYLSRQWSVPEGSTMTRGDLERIIRNSGWNGEIVVNDDNCNLQYTNSNRISCEANGTLGHFDVDLTLIQTRGDVWRIIFRLEPERQHLSLRSPNP